MDIADANAGKKLRVRADFAHPLYVAGRVLGLLLTALATISTILAELWFPVHADLARSEVWPLLLWSRFLAGGGGLRWRSVSLPEPSSSLKQSHATRLPRTGSTREQDFTLDGTQNFIAGHALVALHFRIS